MKKTVLTVASVLLLLGAIKAQDEKPKAFKKGDFTINLGAGFGVYATKVHQEHDQDVWNPTTMQSEKVRVVHDTTDGAASTIYPLSFEYGLTNWLGIGARFAYSNYFEEKDTISNTKPKANGFDADIAVNVHLIKSKRFDMPICLYMGYSSFKFASNDPFNSVAKDNGLNYGIGLQPRIYFGEHIGMYFNVGYAGYSYPSMEFSNDVTSNANEVNNWVYGLKGNGFNLGLGLITKF